MNVSREKEVKEKINNILHTSEKFLIENKTINPIFVLRSEIYNKSILIIGCFENNDEKNNFIYQVKRLINLFFVDAFLFSFEIWFKNSGETTTIKIYDYKYKSHGIFAGFFSEAINMGKITVIDRIDAGIKLNRINEFIPIPDELLSILRLKKNNFHKFYKEAINHLSMSEREILFKSIFQNIINDTDQNPILIKILDEDVK